MRRHGASISRADLSGANATSSSGVAGSAPAPAAPTAGASSAAEPVLYPALEASVAPLEDTSDFREMVKFDKNLAKKLQDVAKQPCDKLLEGMGDTSILPSELLQSSASAKRSYKIDRAKQNPLTRLKDLPNEEVDDEEATQQDEEEEDEEVAAGDEEEDDAGGDYLVSHFDNGEGFDDNEDEGEDVASTM